MQPITVSAALLAALPAVMATGKAIVINNCDEDVNVWTADTERGQLGPETIKGSGGKWSEAYYMVGDGSSSNGGVSIKLSTTDSCEGPITQYEYTYSSSGTPNLWYDISNVNCKGDACPFYTGGFYLDADISVDCGPLTFLCDAVYNLWNDDKATHGTEATSPPRSLLLPPGPLPSRPRRHGGRGWQHCHRDCHCVRDCRCHPVAEARAHCAASRAPQARAPPPRPPSYAQVDGRRMNCISLGNFYSSFTPPARDKDGPDDWWSTNKSHSSLRTQAQALCVGPGRGGSLLVNSGHLTG
ncbi:hypothetical protein B0J12DRAFT_44221 [Macrophomina phaseolina]|uniref:Uncharacterized protein n=1 Tax=Macrophomina phaseolina TaxID=35725 RepID=A0ABQ8GDN1_9PEZI|nr:hypothetical protein B0J12DRAFT_44221 [Macrophomina phaseolina]